MNQTSVFKENYHGILTHNGEIKVAKTEITGKILNINERNVLVKSRTKSYVCEIHKDLYPLMRYVCKGDLGYIKFRKGIAWFVGYRKQNADNTPTKPTGDKPVSENTDWIAFFNKMDMEWIVYE